MTVLANLLLGYQFSIPFPPPALGTPYLQLDGNLGITVATGVSSWLDQSGHSTANASQATAGKQPTYSSSDAAFNNQGTLSFNGTSSNLATGNLGISQPNTWYFVGTSSVINGSFIEMQSGARQGIFTPDASGNVGLYAGVQIQTTTASPNLTTPSIVAVVCDSAGAGSKIYICNSATSRVSGNAGTQGVGAICIGAFTGSANFLNGKIAYILGYQGAHTAAQISTVFTPLGLRYGIVAS